MSWEEFHEGQLSAGQLFRGELVRGNCPGGSCPVGNFMGATVRGAVAQVEIVTDPYKVYYTRFHVPLFLC